MNKTIFFYALSLPILLAGECKTWNYGNIHVFGDSHSACSYTNMRTHHIGIMAPPANNWPITYESSYFVYKNGPCEIFVPFHIHWISRTMHMIGKNNFTILDFKKHGVEEDDIVLLHFGGIDSYHGHFIHQHNNGRDIYEIMDTLAKNFVTSIVANYERYNNITVIVMALIPPQLRQHHINIFVPRDPYKTASQFMVTAHRILNAALKKYSDEQNFLYFDVTALFEDAQGLLRLDRSDDHHARASYNYLIKNSLTEFIFDRL